MYEGNWKCSSCGGAITQLPFQPRSESGLTCRVCYAKQKDSQTSSTPPPEMETASEPMPTDGIPDFDESHIADEPMPTDDGLGSPVSAPNGDKPKFTGEWSCAVCGGAITSLPFAPRDTSSLKCIECFKESKR